MAKAKTVPIMTSVHLPKFDLRSLEVKLIGDSPLIVHAWSEKAKKQMLDKQMGKAKSGRAVKDPEQDFRDSLYHFPGGGYGFPIVGFKAAAVDAASLGAGLTKVQARGAFHVGDQMVSTELVKIISGEPQIRSDMVKIAMGTADIRFRGEFWPWAAIIPVRFNAGLLSAEQIMNLFNIAGFSVGIGEWRTQRDGNKGMFHVATTEEWNAIFEPVKATKKKAA